MSLCQVEAHKAIQKKVIENYDPHKALHMQQVLLCAAEDPNASGDPFKTLFVGRISGPPKKVSRDMCSEATIPLRRS